MKFAIDHDLHIHSRFSPCIDCPAQTGERILQYAKDYGLKHICVTDHYWNEQVPDASHFKMYREQNYEKVSRILPLPQADGIRFHFGCEAEMDVHEHIGLNEDDYARMEFFAVPLNHLHLSGFVMENQDLSTVHRAFVFVSRFMALTASDLPEGRTGVAHITCRTLDIRGWKEHIAVIDAIPDDVYADLFRRAKARNYGIEINVEYLESYGNDLDKMLRPYFIAKEQGCKFYLGSDAHSPNAFPTAIDTFHRMVDLLHLEETDKYRPFDA